jgi:hypothetical protein
MNTPALQALRDQRTYFVSDERLRTFAKLSPLQRLQWVEQCSQFVRMAQQAKAKAMLINQAPCNPNPSPTSVV